MMMINNSIFCRGNYNLMMMNNNFFSRRERGQIIQFFKTLQPVSELAFQIELSEYCAANWQSCNNRI